ncbi:hypothetical protein F2P81_008415 [Scophthalmus maximus]|uniref:Uncharacterized protein n=1 Tax=Scophthalmus maximus TaxID=52904 RepID=A0A6A4T872_SCOMX|nr:hypothetical protein F2P81_008415 [Scophthalmus maximus]
MDVLLCLSIDREQMALPTRRFPLTGPPREPSAHSPESDGPRFDFDDVRECGGDDDDTDNGEKMHFNIQKNDSPPTSMPMKPMKVAGLRCTQVLYIPSVLYPTVHFLFLELFHCADGLDGCSQNSRRNVTTGKNDLLLYASSASGERLLHMIGSAPAFAAVLCCCNTSDEVTDDEVTDDEVTDDEVTDDEVTDDEVTDGDVTDDDVTLIKTSVTYFA